MLWIAFQLKHKEKQHVKMIFDNPNMQKKCFIECLEGHIDVNHDKTPIQIRKWAKSETCFENQMTTSYIVNCVSTEMEWTAKMIFSTPNMQNKCFVSCLLYTSDAADE